MGEKHIWMRNGKSIASEFLFDVKVANENRAIETLKERWENYILRWNVKTVKQARGAWQTSKLYVRFEFLDLVVENTAQTVVIVLAPVFFSMLVFTCNLVISLYVVLSTMSTFAFLAFFIIVVMNWPVGTAAVEALRSWALCR